MKSPKSQGPTRRQLLGCAGGLLTLPLLDVDRVAAALPGRTAKRFATFGAWDGVIPAEFFPEGGETDFRFRPMSEPLSRHRANLILMKGVDERVAIEAKGKNGHIEGVLAFLTGWTGTEDPPKSNRWTIAPGATSIDQHIAKEQEKRGVVTRYPSMLLGTQAGAGGYGAYWYQDGRPVSSTGSVSKLYTSFFGDPGQTGDALAKAQALKRSVLDGAMADYQRAAGRVSGEDRKRITAHLEAMRDLEKRLTAPAATVCDKASFTPGSSTGLTKDKIWRNFLDLSVLALSCDMTRILGFSFDHAGGGGPSMPWVDVNIDMHELSHQVVGSTKGPTHPAWIQFTRVVRWFNSELAYFVDRLKAVKLPDGTSLFDETVVLQGSELSFDHTQPDMPFIILAGDKTPLRTGRFVQMPPKTPHNNLLVTLLHAFGIEAQTWGNPAYSTGNLDGAFLHG